jgi:hypothetical protein
MPEYLEKQLKTLDVKVIRAGKKKHPSFWRKSDPIMDEVVERRVKVGGMWEAQRKWWDLKDFFRVLVGGFGSGKSLVGGKWAISMALQNSEIPFGCVSPSFPLARKTMVPTLIELLAGKQTIYGNELWWKHRKTPGNVEFEIKFRGRTGIIFIMSGEDPLSLRGPNLCGALIDEPFIQNVDVFRQMVARVRHPHATHMAVGLTGTPENINWGYELCLGDMKDEYEKMGLSVGVVHASTRNNLAVGSEYVNRLESTFSGKATNAYVDGQFVNLSKGVVMYGFDRDKNIKHIPYKFQDGQLVVDVGNGAEIAEWCCGMDFNVNPMAFIVGWHTESHMHWVEEFELDNSDTEYACSVLRDEFRTGGKKGPNYYNLGLREIYPDPTGNRRQTTSPGGKTDFHYIKQNGFEVRARSAHPNIRDLENAVNGKLAPRTGPVGMTIEPTCKKLIHYYSNHTHEMKLKQENMTHLIRASQYPVELLFPIVRDTPVVQVLYGA